MCFGGVADYLIFVPHTFRLQGMEVGVEAKPGPDPDDIRKLDLDHNFEVWTDKKLYFLYFLALLTVIAIVFASALDSHIDPKTPHAVRMQSVSKQLVNFLD